jgi:RNA polymerase sigma factor (sigma-70 family)
LLLATTSKGSETRKMDDFYINKVLSGDYNSYSYFIKTYKRFAFSISYAILKDENLTEEVVQDSFVKAFRHLKSFKKESKFQTWLGRIVINESIRVSKTKVVEYVVYDEIPGAAVEILNDSIESLTQEEQKYYISTVFEFLSTNEALALELFYLQENSIVEITELTGWSESKIKMLLLRGRRSFYTHLKKILKTEIKEII